MAGFAAALVLLSACASQSPGNTLPGSASAVSRIGPPPPPPPALRVWADGKLLSPTALNDVPRGRVALRFAISPPRGSVVTAFVVGVSTAMPTWEGPETQLPHGEQLLIRQAGLHLDGPDKLSVTWTPARPGRAFLGVWFVANSRHPPDNGQEYLTDIPLIVVSR